MNQIELFKKSGVKSSYWWFLWLGFIIFLFFKNLHGIEKIALIPVIFLFFFIPLLAYIRNLRLDMQWKKVENECRQKLKNDNHNH